MKHLFHILILLGYLALPLAPVGCSTDAQLKTYKTQAVTHSAVRAAMRGWNAYVASGKAKLDDERKVKAAYDKYRAAQIAVATTAQNLVNSNPDDPMNQDNVKRAVEAVSVAMAELLGLLAQYGISTQ